MADNWQRSPAHKALSKAGKQLGEPNALVALYKLAMRLLWHTTGFVCLGYGLAVPILLVLCNNVAERSWWSALAMYMPWGVWLLPIPLLVPFALLIRPAALLPLLIPVGAVFWYLDFSWAGEKEAPEDTWQFITLSIGQRSRASAVQLLDYVAPEIAVLQEAQRFRGYKLLSEDFHQARYGEFQTISQFRILETKPIVFRELYPLPIAHRCLLMDNDARLFVVYNIHLPTPRRDLRKMHGTEGWLKTLVKRDGFLNGNNRAYFEDAMSRRLEMAERLVELIAAETMPVIAAGDLNIPRRSHSYRAYTNVLEDIHPKVGYGFDKTFPGYTNQPLALFKPWLRLDYIFTSEHWEVYNYLTENSNRPQHLAVVTELRLRDEPEPGN